VEHHGAGQENDQRAIAKEYPDALGFAAFLAIIGATGELVVDLGRFD